MSDTPDGENDWVYGVYDLRPKSQLPLPAPAPPPPKQPWWKRHATALRETGLGGIAFTCAIAAWTLGGDMTLTTIVVFVGWLAGSIGLATAPEKSTLWKWSRIVALFLAFLTESGFLYWHFHGSEKPPALASGASVGFAPQGPRLLSDGYVFPMRIVNSGDAAMLNYDYRFGETSFNHILTVGEMNDAFDDAAGKEFYPLVEKVPRERLFPRSILNSIKPGNFIEPIQPTYRFSEDQIQQINGRRLFVYHFVVIRYTDPSSMERDTYYYGEYCARYEPTVNGRVLCPVHNFMKRPGK
jgi:hypothetical protein